MKFISIKKEDLAENKDDFFSSVGRQFGPNKSMSKKYLIFFGQNIECVNSVVFDLLFKITDKTKSSACIFDSFDPESKSEYGYVQVVPKKAIKTDEATRSIERSNYNFIAYEFPKNKFEFDSFYKISCATPFSRSIITTEFMEESELSNYLSDFREIHRSEKDGQVLAIRVI